MLIGDDIAFAHMPRTGGTFTATLLHRHHVGQRSKEYRGHTGVRRVAEQRLSGKLVFGNLRDPESWYRSIYLHYRNEGGRKSRNGNRFEGFLLAVLGPGDMGFNEVVSRLTRPGTHGLDLAKKVQYPGSTEVPFHLLYELDRLSIGLWSWMVLQMFAMKHTNRFEDIAWGVDMLVDHGHLREGIVNVLRRRIEHPELEQALAVHQKLNEGRPGRAGHNPLGLDFALDDLEKADGWLAQPLGLFRPVSERPQVVELPCTRGVSRGTLNAEQAPA